MERNTSGELQAAEGLVNFGEAGDVKQPRRRVLSRKALLKVVQEKRPKCESLHKRLLSCMHAVEGQGVDSSSGQVFMNDLKSISQQFSQALDELIDLYSQDKHGELGDSLNTDHYINDIKGAYVIMHRINIRTNKSLGTRSLVSSRHSSNRCIRSRASSSSSRASSARLKALAEVEAARKSAEFERLIAEKELERKKCEAEIEQERAQFSKDLAILTADKKVAVADAKLKAGGGGYSHT